MSADKVDSIAAVVEKKIEESPASDDAVLKVAPPGKETEIVEHEENGECEKKENGSGVEQKEKESPESTENGESTEPENDTGTLKRKSVADEKVEDSTPSADGATPEKKAKLVEADSEKNGAEVESA